MSEKWKEFLELVKTQCPNAWVMTEPEECLIYSHGCYPREYKWLLQGAYPYLTRAVVVPENEAEVQKVVALANEMSVGIIPYGGGSGIVGGSIPYEGEIIIDTKRLQDFSINVINGTARGGAGLTGAEFENMLNEHGYTCGQYPLSLIHI